MLKGWPSSKLRSVLSFFFLCAGLWGIVLQSCTGLSLSSLKSTLPPSILPGLHTWTRVGHSASQQPAGGEKEESAKARNELTKRPRHNVADVSFEIFEDSHSSPMII